MRNLVLYAITKKIHNATAFWNDVEEAFFFTPAYATWYAAESQAESVVRLSNLKEVTVLEMRGTLHSID